MEPQLVKKRPSVILLDVYETILDMTDVERKVNAILNHKRAYTIWFELLMEYCFVDNCTSQFNPFSSIAKATLLMTARKLEVSLGDDKVDDIMALLKQLPLKDNVREGLSQLYDLDLRIAALTNASESMVCRRMETTGLISYFENVLSAEHVKKYKPSREVYEWAAKKLHADAGEILMVSSHGWDIAGAANAGFQTAYLVQNRDILYPLAPKPDYQIKNIGDLVEVLSAIAM